MLFSYLLLVPTLTLAVFDCPEEVWIPCGADEMSCDNYDNNWCRLGNYCQPNQYSNVCKEPCPTIESEECMEGMLSCEGDTIKGCKQGDYCMWPASWGEGSECPVVCNEPAPAICNPTEVRCDRGTTTAGKDEFCWQGDYCLPEGSICPWYMQYCYVPKPITCDGDYSVKCEKWHGGCKNYEWCMANGSVCPPSCKIEEPAICNSKTDVVCDNGYDENGCWLGESCLPIGSACP